MKTFRILAFASWICAWGWSSVLGDGILANPTHSIFVIFVGLICACVWSVSHPRLFRLEFVKMTDFYALNVVQNY